MAKKKPIVITQGRFERLQAGDFIDVGNTITKTNNTGNSLVVCTPVYISSNSVIPARADNQATSEAAGLVAGTAADTQPVDVNVDNILVATTAEWDAVTGQTGGLTPGIYYLSKDTAGRMTATAPDDDGEFVVRLGRALSATEFEIEIAQPIKL